MLVLSRKTGQSVVIEDGAIRITVLGVKGNTIRLGFEADPQIQIDRAEVHQRRLETDCLVNAPPIACDAG